MKLLHRSVGHWYNEDKNKVSTVHVQSVWVTGNTLIKVNVSISANGRTLSINVLAKRHGELPWHNLWHDYRTPNRIFEGVNGPTPTEPPAELYEPYEKEYLQLAIKLIDGE